ncbi:hypothetical protein GEMRC1_010498 [Eukaryota sp. GEM-RC1]
MFHWLKHWHSSMLLEFLASIMEVLKYSSGYLLLQTSSISNVLNATADALKKCNKSIMSNNSDTSLYWCFQLLAIMSSLWPEETSALFYDQSAVFESVNVAVSQGEEAIGAVQTIVQNLKQLVEIQDSIIAKTVSLLNSPLDDSNLLQVMKILGCFSTSTLPITDFILKNVLPHLKHQDQEIRFAAGKAVLFQLSYNMTHCKTMSHSHFVPQIFKILMAVTAYTISETSFEYRYELLSIFYNSEQFFNYFQKDDLLIFLTQTLYDENIKVRTIAVQFVSKIANASPGIAAGFLISLFESLLFQYEFSERCDCGVDVPLLLGTLVRSAAPLIKQHVALLLRSFIYQSSKLQEKIKNAAKNKQTLTSDEILSQLPRPEMLDTISDVILKSERGLWNLSQRNWELFSTAKFLLDNASTCPQLAPILRLMTCITQSAVIPIEPYFIHPDLFSRFEYILLHNQNLQTRLHCLRSIGAIGALDPFILKHNDFSGKSIRNTSLLISLEVLPQPIEEATPSLASLRKSVEGLEGDIGSAFSVNKDIKIAGIVVHHLLYSILHEDKPTIYKQCFLSLSQIWRFLQAESQIFIRYTFEPVYHVLERVSEQEVLHAVLNSVANLIAVVKGHCRLYVDEILHIFELCWSDQLISKICLILETLSQSLADDFQGRFARIFIKLFTFISNLTPENMTPEQSQAVSNILKTFSIISDRLLSSYHQSSIPYHI